MEHIAKTYSCDRCGADMGERLTVGYRKTDIAVSYTLKWTQAAKTVRWEHICDSCFELLESVFPINEHC
jgi:hypothetical protein